MVKISTSKCIKQDDNDNRNTCLAEKLSASRVLYFTAFFLLLNRCVCLHLCN